MTHQPSKPNTAAERLLGAIDAADAPDPIDCEQAQARLPELVEAEAAGADVDEIPEYAELLRHLDTCAECMALYTRLAADVAALLSDDAAPAPLPAPPAFFRPARHSEGVLLRVLGGLRRVFELELRVALPALGTLSSAPLFADTLPEVPGAPLLAVSLAPSGPGQPPDLLVAVREAGAARWQVQLAAGATSRSATTDERGVARFAGVELKQGEQLQLTCQAVDEA